MAIPKEYEASLMGQGGQEFGIALYPQKGAVKLIAKLWDSGREREALKIGSVAVTFDKDPPWVASAISDGFGLPRVPVPMKIEGGQPTKLDVESLGLLAATLMAASKLSPGTPTAKVTLGEGDGEITVEVRAPGAAVSAELSDGGS